MIVRYAKPFREIDTMSFCEISHECYAERAYLFLHQIRVAEPPHDVCHRSTGYEELDGKQAARNKRELRER